MRRTLALAGSLVWLCATSACGVYFGEGDDDCEFGGAVDDSADREAPEPPLRNPDTGVCESFSSRPPGCEDPCQPCTAGAEADALIPIPTWGTCDGFCEALDEATCLDTAGCRGVYVTSGVRTCEGAGCAEDALAFYECWRTDQTGPVQGGSCEGLDATSCSLHDDCVAIHSNAGCPVDAAGVPVECNPLGLFERCADERDDTPPQGTCDGVVTCDVPPPDCPADTVPGVKDGCYSGFCIPVSAC